MARFGAAMIVVLAGLAATDAEASPAGVAAIKNWSTMDRCSREAQNAFPDYTAEAYAKRDAKLKECLESKSLPPRAPLAPGN